MLGKGFRFSHILCCALSMLLLLPPCLGQDPPLPSPEPEDPEFAFWGEFIYTLLWRDKLIWTVTPSFRTDEQEINGNFVTRFTTEATYRFPKGWELRGRFFLLGRDKEVGAGAAFDQRIQLLVRYPLTRFRDGALSLDGGTLYERHFRGDEVSDFNVYRQRFELSAENWKYSPWVQQDLSFDHARGFYRTRTRLGLLYSSQRNSQIAVAYQFQYTQRQFRSWAPQHAILFRYWFGKRLSARGG